jgi:hypothetical protein
MSFVSLNKFLEFKLKNEKGMNSNGLNPAHGLLTLAQPSGVNRPSQPMSRARWCTRWWRTNGPSVVLSSPPRRGKHRGGTGQRGGVKVHLGPMWVWDDWWPTIRGLTIYKEFCRAFHSKRQCKRFLKNICPTMKKKGKVMKILDN